MGQKTLGQRPFHTTVTVGDDDDDDGKDEDDNLGKDGDKNV